MYLEVTPTQLALTFNSPLMLLLGICGCAVPIAIHLFKTKKNQPLEWAAMEFLVEAWAQVKNKTRLHHYALLSTRCCIPLVIGLILSNPTTSTQTQTKKHHLFIVVDNGVISSTVTSPSSNDLQINKQIAIDQVIQSEEPHHFYILATSDINKQPSVFNNAYDATTHINNIDSTYMPTDIPGALLKIQTYLYASNIEAPHVYIASQFRAGSCVSNQQTGEWPNKSTLIYSPPAAEKTSNIKIESVRPLRSYRINNPNNTEPTLDGVEVNLSKDTNTKIDEPIQIEIISDTSRELLNAHWPPGEKKLTVLLNPHNANTKIVVKLNNTDSLQADNTHYTSIPIFNEIQTTIINRSDNSDDDLERWLRLALKPHQETPIHIIVADPATLQDKEIQESTCVFLLRPELCNEYTWSRLYKHIQDDGLLVIFPPPDTAPSPWIKNINNTFGLNIQTTVNTNTPDQPLRVSSTKNSDTLFSSIKNELDTLINPLRINKHNIYNPDENSLIILELENNHPAAIYNNLENTTTGGIVLFSFSLDSNWSNLLTKPFMVPLVQELVRNSFEANTNHATVFTGDTAHDISATKNVSFIQQGSTRVSTTTQPDHTPQLLRTPGHWTTYDENNMALDTHPVNIDPRTTNIQPSNDIKIKSYLGDKWTQSMSTPPKKTTYSFQNLLVLLLAAIVLIETIVAKRLSTKSPTTTTTTRGRFT